MMHNNNSNTKRLNSTIKAKRRCRWPCCLMGWLVIGVTALWYHRIMIESNTGIGTSPIILKASEEDMSIDAESKETITTSITTTANNHHRHTIPNILIFTHYKNLLQFNAADTDNTSEEDQELQALANNVKHMIALHSANNVTVRFLTDADCERSIQNVMGFDTPLLHFFRQETQGMYKSDICRGAALWETGGLYMDVDLGARMSLWDVLYSSTEFVTIDTYDKSKQRPGFFQAFIGTTPRHPILKRYLELFVEYYQGKFKLANRRQPVEELNFLGVKLLRKAYDELARLDPNHPLLLTVEVWKEAYYSQPKYFPGVPPPTTGKSSHNKACRYVVVSNPGRFPPMVPFYSRVPGSRLCGGQDTS